MPQTGRHLSDSIWLQHGNSCPRQADTCLILLILILAAVVKEEADLHSLMSIWLQSGSSHSRQGRHLCGSTDYNRAAVVTDGSVELSDVVSGNFVGGSGCWTGRHLSEVSTD